MYTGIPVFRVGVVQHLLQLNQSLDVDDVFPVRAPVRDGVPVAVVAPVLCVLHNHRLRGPVSAEEPHNRVGGVDSLVDLVASPDS